MKQPPGQHRPLPQSPRAPGENEEHRACHFLRVVRAAGAPQRRRMDKRQVTLDHRPQALYSGSSLPHLEAFSICSEDWWCWMHNAAILTKLAPSFQAHADQQTVQCRASCLTWFPTSYVPSK